MSTTLSSLFGGGGGESPVSDYQSGGRYRIPLPQTPASGSFHSGVAYFTSMYFPKKTVLSSIGFTQGNSSNDNRGVKMGLYSSSGNLPHTLLASVDFTISDTSITPISRMGVFATPVEVEGLVWIANLSSNQLSAFIVTSYTRSDIFNAGIRVTELETLSTSAPRLSVSQSVTFTSGLPATANTAAGWQTQALSAIVEIA